MELVDEVVAVTEPEEVDGHERQHRQPPDGQKTVDHAAITRTNNNNDQGFFQLRSLKALTCSDH